MRPRQPYEKGDRGARSPLGLKRDARPLAGVAAMVVTQAAFGCIPFMNVAFHCPHANAAAWLRVIGVALTTSVIVGFERRVHTQAEKSQTPDAHARAAAASLRP